MDKEKWRFISSSYWSSIASKYDNLYSDIWSALENNYITGKLSFLDSTLKPNILDLGCGTGLGFNLVSKINPNTNYQGLDISGEMLNKFKENHPNLVCHEGSMSDLSMFQSNTFDAIISIFSAFSYTEDSNSTVKEIVRVLKPNGYVFISVLSKFSMRRLYEFKFADKEKYKTQGDTSDGFTYATVYTPKKLKKLFRNYGFQNIIIDGYNIFSGFKYLKYPPFWKINLYSSNRLPNLSHELILTGKIKKNV